MVATRSAFFWGGWKCAQIPFDLSGSRMVLLLQHQVPMTALFLSPPVWFYVAEQSCAYPGEEVHLLCVLKKLRWDQVFQRAWGPTRV